MEKKDFRFEVKQIAEDGTFEGHAAVFGNVDKAKEMVEPGAFTKTLLEKKEFPVSWIHDVRDLLGSAKAEQDNVGLKVNGLLNLAVQSAKEKYALMKQGVIRMLSMGYDVLKDFIDEAGVRHLQEIKLYEIALVPWGMNPEAQITSVKAAIPFKDLGFEQDEAAAWDGPAETTAADVADLKIICAWYDSQNADVKGSYKLPHHRAGSHKAVWAGVRAAMGALLGALGGVDIPVGDKKGVYNHLAKHYKDWTKEPPAFKSLDDVLSNVINFQEYFEKEEKSGRVISSANMKLIQKAIEALSALFKAAQPDNSTDGGGKSQDRDGKSDSHLLERFFDEAEKFKKSITGGKN